MKNNKEMINKAKKKQKKDENQSIKEVMDSDDSKQNKTLGKEIGGRNGLEPTRYGDWEKNGRCIDF
jgi:hypothetical protein